MTATSQRLPTLLLGAFALWCLIVAICVYAGLGARYGLHPDDASRVPELPRLDLSRAQNPVAALSEYAQVAERPLFNADRRPIPPANTPTPDDGPAPTAPLDVILTSVILTSDAKIAIVLDKKNNKSQSVKLGATLEGEQAGWKLIELSARKAVFEGPAGDRNEAELRVFDGSGGEAPTPVASSTPATPEAVVADPNAPASAAQSPESRAELIRRRIEERRRQMREEAERANKQNDGQ